MGEEGRGVGRWGLARQAVSPARVNYPASPWYGIRCLAAPPLSSLPSTLCKLQAASSLSASGDDSLHSSVFHCGAV